MRSTRAISTATLASAATVDLASSDAEYVVITGTTNISNFGTGFPGCLREVHFSGSLTLQHSVNLFLPGGANITTQADDVYYFRCYGPGTWIMVGGARSTDPTKAPLVSPALTGTPTISGIAIGYRGVPLTT